MIAYKASVFHNPRAELQYGCQSCQAWDQRSASGIWSLLTVHRYMAFVCRHRIHKDTDSLQRSIGSWQRKLRSLLRGWWWQLCLPSVVASFQELANQAWGIHLKTKHPCVQVIFLPAREYYLLLPNLRDWSCDAAHGMDGAWWVEFQQEVDRPLNRYVSHPTILRYSFLAKCLA